MKMLLLWTPLILAACTFARRQPDGSQTFLQVGGKGAYVGNADGSMVVQADNEKSMRDALAAAAATAIGLGYFNMEKAATAANAATAQQATRAGAATEQARIKATERAATTLGSNPEANTGAINAAGNLFR